MFTGRLLMLTGSNFLKDRLPIVAIAIALAFLYLTLQFIFGPHLLIVMDEFQGASAVYKSVSETPYRDFTPYKPVLGYWLQSIFAGTYVSAVDYFEDLKFGIRIVNILAVVSLFSLLATTPGFASKRSVAFAFTVMLLVSTFVERSAALRVDMLTVWVGVFASIAYLREKYFIAGGLIGLGFLVSQKIYFYGVSWAVTLGLFWLLRSRKIELFKSGAGSLLACLVVILLYIVIFGMQSSYSSVFSALFLKKASMAFSDSYQGLSAYWFQSVSRNFLFYCLLAFALASMISKLKVLSDLHWKVAVFSFVYAFLCILHKQPWPYFIPFLISLSVLLIPAWLENSKKSANLILFLSFTLIYQVGVQIGRYLEVRYLSNQSQLEQVGFLEGELKPGEIYLAGVNLVPTHGQVPGLEWLDAPRVQAINQNKGINALEMLNENPPEYILENYRTQQLTGVHDWIRQEYVQICGNLWRKRSADKISSQTTMHERQVKGWDCTEKPLFGDVYGY